MQHYVAREIIRQHTGEMRAQASRLRTAQEARKAQHAGEARGTGQGREADQPGLDPVTAPETVPPQRVPDDAYRAARPRAHAC
jgi:hypothetical protein